MFKELEIIRQYCIGGLSPIPAFDESTPYMQGYRRALENVQAYIEREQERIIGDAMAADDRFLGAK